MLVQRSRWDRATGWRDIGGSPQVGQPQIVLYFAAPGTFGPQRCYFEICRRYPNADIIGCGTRRRILAQEVPHGTIATTAIRFDDTKTRLASTSIRSSVDSFGVGVMLGEALLGADLRAVFVLSDGIRVSGSGLFRGITEVIGDDVPLTGGMAGDGSRFEVALVSGNESADEGRIAAFGVYGPSLPPGNGSVRSWDEFGPGPITAHAGDNVLYELDRAPALDL